MSYYYTINIFLFMSYRVRGSLGICCDLMLANVKRVDVVETNHQGVITSGLPAEPEFKSGVLGRGGGGGGGDEGLG